MGRGPDAIATGAGSAWATNIDDKTVSRIDPADLGARAAAVPVGYYPSDLMVGGGSIWVTGTYDPEQNLVFFGTGNPGPDYYGNAREGDNLYTASLVALDADTGKPIEWGPTINLTKGTCYWINPLILSAPRSG